MSGEDRHRVSVMLVVQVLGISSSDNDFEKSICYIIIFSW
jgi:hypothetical protein